MSSDSEPEHMEMSQFSRKVQQDIKDGCGRVGRFSSRNVAAEAEKKKIAAEAEAEAEKIKIAAAAADKMKKNKQSKKQSARIQADCAASEAYTDDNTISVGELRAIRGAAQASALAASAQKKKESRKPRCRKKAEPTDGADGADRGGNGGVNPLAGLAKPASAATQQKRGARKRKEVKFSSPEAAKKMETRKKKDIKATPAAKKLAAAKPAAETPDAATADPPAATAVVAHPDDTPAETEMLDSSESDESNAAFFAGVDKTISNFCAKNTAPSDDESDDSSVISIVAAGQEELDYNKLGGPELLCHEEFRDSDYDKLGAAAIAREFEGTRKELFNELDYGGSPGVDGGRAAGGGGRGAKRAGRGAKAERKRRGWQVESSGAPSGAERGGAARGAAAQGAAARGAAARGAAPPTVLEAAGTTLGEAQLLAALAGDNAAAEASNEKIARRMQEEEDRGEEAAMADNVLVEVLGALGALGEEAGGVADAIGAVCELDAGIHVIL